MLPQHYQVHREGSDDDEETDSRRSRPIGSGPAQPFQPPLGVTGVLCDTHTLLIKERGTLQYTIFRPRYVHMKPPLVCVAGGPYLPWQYLSTLVHLVNDRSLVFFDPIGCGPSKRIKEDAKSTSSEETKKTERLTRNPVPDMVSDLCRLVDHLKLKHYHLFGHSFGGIVAYEALASGGLTGKCLSLVLSSTPADLPMALQEIQELKAALAPQANSSLLDPKLAVERMFAESYECRVRPLPLQLQQSFDMAGFSSSPSSWQSVGSYVVQPPEMEGEKPNLPLLLLRGEFDFISEACMEKWHGCVRKTELDNDQGTDHGSCVTTIPGVAHYGMLENEQAFGAALRTFLGAISEPPLQIPLPTPPTIKKRSHLIQSRK